MPRKFFIPIVFFALGGCAAFPTKSSNAFVAKAGDAEAVVDRLLSQRASLVDEVTFSADSADYLHGAWQLKKQRIYDHCTRTDESALQSVRTEALKRLRAYVEALGAYLEPAASIDKAQKLLDATTGLLSLAIANEVAPISALLQQGVKVAAQADLQRRSIQIRRFVKANQKLIATISSDLVANLKPISGELNIALSKWEICEFEKLQYIQQYDSSATMLEKEARFRLFHDTKAKLVSSIEGADQAQKFFKALPALHAAIADEGDAASRIDALRQSLEPVAATIMAARKL